MVVAVGVTLSGFPVPTGVPPQLPENQSMTSPEFTRAERLTAVPEHTVLGLAVGPVGVEGRGFTVTVTDAHALLPQLVVVQRAK